MHLAWRTPRSTRRARALALLAWRAAPAGPLPGLRRGDAWAVLRELRAEERARAPEPLATGEGRGRPGGAARVEALAHVRHAARTARGAERGVHRGQAQPLHPTASPLLLGERALLLGAGAQACARGDVQGEPRGPASPPLRPGAGAAASGEAAAVQGCTRRGSAAGRARWCGRSHPRRRAAAERVPLPASEGAVRASPGLRAPPARL